jgi:hypothetical protein
MLYSGMFAATMAADQEARLLSPALAAAAARFGTPVYVIDMAGVAAAAGRLEATFGRPWLRLYSLKANDLPAITAFLHGHGWAASNGRPPPAEVLLWPDSSLQPCERPALSGTSWPDPARAPHSAARHLPQDACRTVGSPPATKESLP